MPIKYRQESYKILIRIPIIQLVNLTFLFSLPYRNPYLFLLALLAFISEGNKRKGYYIESCEVRKGRPLND